MAAVLGRSAGLLVYVGVVVMLVLGLATPASSLLINTTSSSCSSQCESKDCTDPFKLRYGKFCGVGYTGCSGQTPCDGLDSCCATHDMCIGPNIENYLNKTCNGNLKNCVTNFKNSNGALFSGNNCSAFEVENLIIGLTDVATADSHGNPSSPINLQSAIILVFIMSGVLLFS